ncbi:histidine kinase [Thiocystis violacea]|uniref:histidine kinase n=1 Tax=Thiocystis violacea TaxID=13725 RepID=UPI001A92351E|nr:histidine kinase [Thiocystis violacea]
MPIFDHDFELTWFDAGSAVFDGIIDPACFPPLGDCKAQREWLAGFAGAWAELPECPGLEQDPRSQPVEEVLARALADRPELLRQLLAIRAFGSSPRTRYHVAGSP